ncbi:formyltransferase family protein [Flavobacteriaceae bacterium]|nr:formyltransferase family protein [Flavobacteriaceae bacterium]
MRFNYAIFCSGNATRIIKFYKKYKVAEFPLKVIIYDGGNLLIEEKLKNIFGEKLINFKHNNTLSKKQQSDSFSLFLLNQFKSKGIDFIFCFGSKILKKTLKNPYKNKIINFHPSLLPKYPGLNAIDQVILNNEKELGNTAHFIDEGIDTGKIILQTRIFYLDYIDYNSVLDLQIDMLNRIWNTIEFDDKQLERLHKTK